MKYEKYGIKWVTSKKETVFERQEFNLPQLKYNSKDSENFDDEFSDIAIIGENFEALRSLLSFYDNEIDFIYIDPPYNTRNSESEFRYNDKRVDENDGYSHSKWLTFMRNRLLISKMLLSKKGVIAVSIDDNEMAPLKVMMDGIFGEENGKVIIWKKKSNASNTEKQLQTITEYILVYKKNSKYNPFNNVMKMNVGFNLYDNERKMYYKLESFTKTNKGSYFRQTMTYDIIDPETGKVYKPKEGTRWTQGKDSVEKLIRSKQIVFKKMPKIKKYMTNELRTELNKNLWLDEGSLKSAKIEIGKITGDSQIFSTPKPSKLIRRLILSLTSPDSIILDFFAGSGTTLQATKEANIVDNGTRKTILVTNSEGDIDKIMLNRIKNLPNLKTTQYKNVIHSVKIPQGLLSGKPIPNTMIKFEKKMPKKTKKTINIETGMIDYYINIPIKHIKSSLNVFDVSTKELQTKLSFQKISDDYLFELVGDTPLLAFEKISFERETKEYVSYETEKGIVHIMKTDDPYKLMESTKMSQFIFKPSRTPEDPETLNGCKVTIVPQMELTNMRKVANLLNDNEEY
ncbi:MAG: site-specific DNA-methyltransferase [Mycoplasmataceae bacterium]|nr:site-specific DNA-methyltransferase [Mycoplasmataceae bacterium]